MVIYHLKNMIIVLLVNVRKLAKYCYKCKSALPCYNCNKFGCQFKDLVSLTNFCYFYYSWNSNINQLIYIHIILMNKCSLIVNLPIDYQVVEIKIESKEGPFGKTILFSGMYCQNGSNHYTLLAINVASI